LNGYQNWRSLNKIRIGEDRIEIKIGEALMDIKIGEA
jgi:hypothetical protein